MPEQRTVLYNSLKDCLKDIIKDGKDLGDVLRYLTLEQCAVVCGSLKDLIKDIINDIIKDIINDGRCFRRVLRYLTPEQGIAVFNVLTDNMKSTCLSPAAIIDKEKCRKIHQFWFESLLHDIPVSANKQNILIPLKKKLTQVSKDFFEKNYTLEGYKIFKKTCQDVINTARPRLRGWDDFFKKIALAIGTIGLAPAIMAVHSKMKKDSFNFSFFPRKEEQFIDKVLHYAEHTTAWMEWGL